MFGIQSLAHELPYNREKSHSKSKKQNVQALLPIITVDSKC